MKTCPSCGAPVNSSCINVHCNLAKKELKSRVKNRAANYKSSVAKSKSVRRNKKRGPDLSKPIPPEVNSKVYVPNPKKSLLSYLGYSRAANQDELKRQEQLSTIISAGPFISSKGNRLYIESFGPPNSKKRVNQIISTIQKQISGQWYVRKDPIKHASKLPALNKAVEDLLWLESQLLVVTMSKMGEKLIEYINQKIRIKYDSLSSGITTREIMPSEVYHFRDNEYLKGHCYNRGEERTFRVDRIIQLID